MLSSSRGSASVPEPFIISQSQSSAGFSHPSHPYFKLRIGHISATATTDEKFMMGNKIEESATTPKPVFFFDIDNCLYSRSHKIHDLMAKLIDQYFVTHLSLGEEEASRLTREYYKTYGLAIEGLVRHHQIDPLDFNAKVDDALPLDDILKPDAELRALLEDIDTSKVKLWLFTNAYVNHGKRVVRLLEVDDLFDGLTYCDYAQFPFVCKPAKEMFRRAMEQAGVENSEDCYFVDDSYDNCKSAKELGWMAAHLVEGGLPVPETQASQFQIRHLRELRDVYPQFFKSRISKSQG